MAERDDLPEHNYPRGYDETVREGPPLDTSVAQGSYHPSSDSLAGAGVRGYGKPGAYAQWGASDSDQRGSGFGTSRGGFGRNFAGTQPGEDRTPPDFGTEITWGRNGGWYDGTSGMQRRGGPKGYKRSDDRILEDLCEHLMDMGDIDVSEVEVRVEGARVILSGTVPERSMKYEIEDIAAQTLGVDDVENNIRVPRRSSDDGLAT